MDVRAYQYAGRTVVQYFDSGDGNYLNCPKCPWEGHLWEVFGQYAKSQKDIQCPCCSAHLASCSRVGAGSAETLAMIPAKLKPYVTPLLFALSLL